MQQVINFVRKHQLWTGIAAVATLIALWLGGTESGIATWIDALEFVIEFVSNLLESAEGVAAEMAE